MSTSETPAKQTIITIVGSGMMGSALVFPARENGHTVRLVGSPLDGEIIDACRKTGRHPKFVKDFPAGVEYYKIEELDKAMDGADLLICGISSFGVEWFAEYMLPRIPETLPVVSVTKGLIDDGTGQLISYPEYWARRAAPRKLRLNAIGGPCTSYELVAQDQTVVTFCGEDLETLRWMKGLMQRPYYHIAVSTDVMGVETAVALKNAYAYGVCITVGACERVYGIDSIPHYNSQAGAFGQSMLEMQKLMRLLGSSNDEALAVGIGDLYVTVFGGRNRLLGKLLGRGLPLDAALKELEGITLEGNVIVVRIVKALRAWAAQGKVDLAEYPLIAHLGEVLIDNKPANIPWEAFVAEKR
ncbi:glycerol-3-phosphate dehydrogenase [Ereboglobus luteus]|uniref:Glycerol-3-phosphate dehydrogenase n=1 Tax=Ereboglobus luteus TaxID=1796921 RepID=A0A2U8E472_9BACT|nr:glycerol-3-phosphate dehydrogenase [Ereboglobus luteus]AWI09606.1 glycerol-3-phosphate dehydrogenase [Ereboglobus luteus]